MQNFDADSHLKLDPERTALLAIDVQNDFGHPDGSSSPSDCRDVVPCVARAMDLFRRARLPVIHVVRLYAPDGSNADICRKSAIAGGDLKLVFPGTWGSQMVAEVNPMGAGLDHEILLGGGVQELGPLEYAIYKSRFGAFSRTGLKDFLDGLGLTGVVVVGITFPNCVRATQLGAVDLDYRTGLVPEACTMATARGVETMRSQGTRIMDLAELEDFLKPRLSGRG